MSCLSLVRPVSAQVTSKRRPCITVCVWGGGRTADTADRASWAVPTNYTVSVTTLNSVHCL